MVDSFEQYWQVRHSCRIFDRNKKNKELTGHRRVFPRKEEDDPSIWSRWIQKTHVRRAKQTNFILIRFSSAEVISTGFVKIVLDPIVF